MNMDGLKKTERELGRERALDNVKIWLKLKLNILKVYLKVKLNRITYMW